MPTDFRNKPYHYAQERLKRDLDEILNQTEARGLGHKQDSQ